MKKSNILIGILVFILFIMVICIIYYSGILIAGKNKDNDWDISIINVQSKDQVGSASNGAAPVYDKTTATFKTILVMPGDSITYEVTVENKSKIDAKVKKITTSKVDNNAILFETSGIKEGQVLKAGARHSMFVKVSYDKDIKTEPEVLKSSLTVKIDYGNK